jgi:hypothetical protein
MRLLRPIPLSVIVLLYASVVAIWGFGQMLDLSLFCSGEPLRGANIGHGQHLRHVFERDGDSNRSRDG